MSWTFACALALPGSGGATAEPLVTAQSQWRWAKGTSEVSNPRSAWRQATFNDSSWLIGPAPFHYGENIAGGTALPDMRNRYSSIFLRHSFVIETIDPFQELRLRAICDDGFIAWINGVEVARFNLPAGELSFNAFASAAVPEPVSFAEYLVPKPDYLVLGTNVLAVQVFNNSLTSSDLRWDAEIVAVQPDLDPPRIASLQPAPGVVERLTEVVITFSEPVTGVQASDLLLASQPAQSVAGSGTHFTFAFPPVQPGSNELRWDADTLVTDLAFPANRLDPTAAGPWLYDLVDRTPPQITELTPPAGITVRRLSEVEIRFSEAVSGVDAADLLINDIPAISVAGSLAGPYRFTFAEPAAGNVRFSWAAGHGIVDLAEPANPLLPETWSVELNPGLVVPPIRINELLASNLSATGLKDEDGELHDWIELSNPGLVPVNLEGWSLTDDRNDPGRWIFPRITVGPGEFLIVFASGKDRRAAAAGARLHTNFKLNPAGEYLALLGPESPRNLVFEFAPAFAEQRNDYSYGFDSAQQLRYFRTPTPGGPNGNSALSGVVPVPHVNVARGWFDAPFTFHATSALPGVTLRYTTDGSEPTETSGHLYASPLRIASTTTLRVAGFKPDMLPSTVATHSYIFPGDVPRQPNDPAGFPVGPTAWNGYPSDYEMDPEIVTHALYSGLMRPALLALPALSIVCRTDDLFGAATGIYINPTRRGPAWERPCSVELIPSDGTAGFQANAGIQIQGNAAREPQKQPKHPFRLVFKGDYGARKLEFPLFKDSPISSFDTLVLRADFNFSWLHWNPHQRSRSQRTRDAWMKDSMRAMGGLAGRNRYVHLFINGLYWGIYDPAERPDGAFAASYLGGEKEDYDIMNEGAVVDGDRRAYDAMLALTDLRTPAAFAEIQRYLDLEQFIDYMLLHFYAGHQDWGNNKNWYALRPRDASAGFFYVPWDGEMILDDLNHNRVSQPDTPSGLHTRLMANSEYRRAFGDHAHKHLFHHGALTPAAVEARWLERARELEIAIVAESARWGDYRRDVHPFQNGPYELFTRDHQWRTEQNRLLTHYFPRRTEVVLAQLRAAGLYPEIAAPEFSAPAGGAAPGTPLTLRAPGAAIYYTDNGSDPRVPGTGDIAGAAKLFTEPIPLDQSVRIQARAWQDGRWSALAEVEFQVLQRGAPLHITELMHHPLGGEAFEFIELRHLGRVALDVGGFSFAGVDYVFPHRTVLTPGQVVVLASSLSPDSFASRYPGTVVSGYFKGALSNSGERVALLDREGRTVSAVTYSGQEPWPARADGQPFSLELIDPQGDPNAPGNWTASSTADGSPGLWLAPALPAPIRLNELMARPAESAPQGENEDWIELANTSPALVSIAGWRLTDYNAGALLFPPGSAIPAHGFIRIWCDGKTNAAGLHAPFKLAQEGETIGLHDSHGRRVDALSFGRQLPGFSLGRVGSDGDWKLTLPTPAAGNIPADLAPPTDLKLNEWLANPRPGGDDWIELHNTHRDRPLALQGLALRTETALAQLPTLSFIAPGGFIRLFAENRSGPEHAALRLPASGGLIELLDGTGQELDLVTYGPQREGHSEGRLPDGASLIVPFAHGGSPGQSNSLRDDSGVILNELLVAEPKTGGGWVELFNASASLAELAGFQIQVEPGGGSWTFPAGVKIGPAGFLVVRLAGAIDLAEPDLWSSLAPHAQGGTLSLRDRSGGVRDQVDYGFQIAGLSIGRIGAQWQLLSAPTPGQANALPAVLGDPKALRFNEWLAASPDGDWFELFNPDARPVGMAGLFLSDNAGLDGQRKFEIGPLTFIGPGSWVVWRANSAPGRGPEHVNFSLEQSGESLRLSSADGAVIDGVDFGMQLAGVSEGRLTDGGPNVGALPTLSPGKSNLPGSDELDQDGDGLPDAWEILYGTDPNVPDAMEDPDLDGASNLDEFLAGTDPQDPKSRLEFAAVSVAASGVLLEFHALSNRAYSVFFARTLEDLAWIKLRDLPPQPVNRMETVIDGAPDGSVRFYRLLIPAQP